MKKCVIINTAILLSLIISCSTPKKAPDLKKAKEAEITGKLQDAFTLYVSSLLQVTPSMKVPDVNRSKILNSELWRKEIEKYVIWISTPAKKPSNDLQTILDGIKRCSEHARSDNSLAALSVRSLSTDQYISEWNNLFFAPTVRIDPSHTTLASGNHVNNVSIIKLASLKNYSYELNLVNKHSGRRTEVFLYPESSTFLLAAPGEYLLICQSAVTFPSGELWKSPFTAMPLSIPENASFIGGELRTSVNRK